MTLGAPAPSAPPPVDSAGPAKVPPALDAPEAPAEPSFAKLVREHWARPGFTPLARLRALLHALGGGLLIVGFSLLAVPEVNARLVWLGPALAALGCAFLSLSASRLVRLLSFANFVTSLVVLGMNLGTRSPSGLPVLIWPLTWYSYDLVFERRDEWRWGESSALLHMFADIVGPRWVFGRLPALVLAALPLLVLPFLTAGGIVPISEAEQERVLLLFTGAMMVLFLSALWLLLVHAARGGQMVVAWEGGYLTLDAELKLAEAMKGWPSAPGALYLAERHVRRDLLVEGPLRPAADKFSLSLQDREDFDKACDARNLNPADRWHIIEQWRDERKARRDAIRAVGSEHP